MGAIFQSLGRTIFAGVVIVAVMMGIAGTFGKLGEMSFWMFFMRWLHVLSGVLWIGLLWYFNFVQIPSMPKIPDEQKPAISKVIAPEALFWFRWAAMATLVTGVLLAGLNGYIGKALALQAPFIAIGIGMWLAIVMFFNVWFIIWPNQKKALGIVQVPPAEKAAAARTAMLTSRFNTMLSIPMLYAMVAQQNAGL
ncbi:MAG: urate hydroxylase PuuD [Proteobacteria bacterium]|nr:urate hydroxylase PuuD [Pseudomonadota bacterium]MDA0983343.1 urate hydroxylase PuuD [Pseudomonadota bacterium]